MRLSDFVINSRIAYVKTDTDELFTGIVKKIVQDTDGWSVWVSFHPGAPYMEFTREQAGELHLCHITLIKD
jgi:hypothetical protein